MADPFDDERSLGLQLLSEVSNWMDSSALDLQTVLKASSLTDDPEAQFDALLLRARTLRSELEGVMSSMASLVYQTQDLMLARMDKRVDQDKVRKIVAAKITRAAAIAGVATSGLPRLKEMAQSALLGLHTAHDQEFPRGSGSGTAGAGDGATADFLPARKAIAVSKLVQTEESPLNRASLAAGEPSPATVSSAAGPEPLAAADPSGSLLDGDDDSDDEEEGDPTAAGKQSGKHPKQLGGHAKRMLHEIPSGGSSPASSLGPFSRLGRALRQPPSDLKPTQADGSTSGSATARARKGLPPPLPLALMRLASAAPSPTAAQAAAEIQQSRKREMERVLSGRAMVVRHGTQPGFYSSPLSPGAGSAARRVGPGSPGVLQEGAEAEQQPVSVLSTPTGWESPHVDPVSRTVTLLATPRRIAADADRSGSGAAARPRTCGSTGVRVVLPQEVAEADQQLRSMIVDGAAAVRHSTAPSGVPTLAAAGGRRREPSQ